MKGSHKQAQRHIKTWADVDEARGPSRKLVSDGVTRGTRSGLGENEAVLETEPGFVEAFEKTKPKREVVQVKKEPTLRPHMAVLMGSAYNIANDMLFKLQSKLDSGQFEPRDASILKAIVSSIVDLGREERAQLATFNPEEYDNDTLTEILRMARNKLGAGEE